MRLCEAGSIQLLPLRQEYAFPIELPLVQVQDVFFPSNRIAFIPWLSVRLSHSLAPVARMFRVRRAQVAVVDTVRLARLTSDTTTAKTQ